MSFFAFDAGERGDGFGLIVDDDGAAMRECRAAKLAGECGVGKVYFWMRSQVRCQIGECLIGGGCGFCGDGEELIWLWLARECSLRRFFQNNVRVGAADAERSDAGAARLARGGPIGELAVDVERAAFELDVGIDLFEVQAGRESARARARARS